MYKTNVDSHLYFSYSSNWDNTLAWIYHHPFNWCCIQNLKKISHETQTFQIINFNIKKVSVGKSSKNKYLEKCVIRARVFEVCRSSSNKLQRK